MQSGFNRCNISINDSLNNTNQRWSPSWSELSRSAMHPEMKIETKHNFIISMEYDLCFDLVDGCNFQPDDAGERKGVLQEVARGCSYLVA